MKKEELGSASLTGRVVGFLRHEIIAIVQTQNGLAYLGVNDTWFPETEVGNQVTAEFCLFYIVNGRIITFPTKSLIINGKVYSSS